MSGVWTSGPQNASQLPLHELQSCQKLSCFFMQVDFFIDLCVCEKHFGNQVPLSLVERTELYT